MRTIDQITASHALESLARTAWLLTEYEPEKDITGIACRIAKRAGGDWAPIRDAILAGLEEMSDQVYEGPSVERAVIGHCVMADIDCWWWHNGGESDWTADRPEWWDEQVEQWTN